MVQEILLILIFVGALVWLGRFLCRQANCGKQDGATCDKCVPKKVGEKN